MKIEDHVLIALGSGLDAIGAEHLEVPAPDDGEFFFALDGMTYRVNVSRVDPLDLV